MSAILDLTLEDKLYRTRYEPDAAHSHITVDGSHCATCDGHSLYF